MTSTPQEPKTQPEVAPAGDPTPAGPVDPDGPQEDPEHEVPLDADEGDPSLKSYPG